MKIGILGSGPVAQALGNGFLEEGHEVMLGTSNASKLKEWKENEGKGAKVGSFTDTAFFGQILVLAVKGSAALDVLAGCGESNFNGKTIIDTTNPIADAPPINGVLQYYTTLSDSQMERLQKAFPKANFVKAFSIIGNAFMYKPEFESTPTMFICGNNKKAKEEVKGILDSFGWEVEDMGMAESARAIEPLAILWCIPGFLNNNWATALKLLKK